MQANFALAENPNSEASSPDYSEGGSLPSPEFLLAYSAAGGDGLDCNLPRELRSLAEMIDGFQSKEGELIDGAGRPIDHTNPDGSVTEGEVRVKRPERVDFKVLGKMARSLYAMK